MCKQSQRSIFMSKQVVAFTLPSVSQTSLTIGHRKLGDVNHACQNGIGIHSKIAIKRKTRSLQQVTLMSMEHSAQRRTLIKFFLSISAIGCNNVKIEEALARSLLFGNSADDLSKRATKTITSPLRGLFQEDLYYPEFFLGLWKTESTLVSVDCPAGYKLFGRAGSFEAAQNELNKALTYKSRFIKSGNNIISDRAYNVKSIAQASMGSRAVLECTQPRDDVNRLNLSLSPDGGNGALYNVKMKVTWRQQQTSPVSEKVLNMMNGYEGDGMKTVERMGLYTGETTQQDVRLDTTDMRVMPMIRVIETITVFDTNEGEGNVIQAWQKTSSYLTKASLQYVDAKGKPIDVRCYRVQYTRIS